MPGITLATIITTIVISATISFGLTVLSRALSPDPKEDAANRGGWRSRIFQSKNPLAPRDMIYGEVRKSGTVVYQEVTSDSRYLHNIIVLGTGEVEAIPVIFLDDYPIYDDDLDSENRVVKGKFAKKVRIVKYLGTDTQVADPTFIIDSDDHWTSSHRLQGMCYIHVILLFDRDVFTSEPAISAYIKGKKVSDPRNLIAKSFSINPASVFRDYVTTGIKDMGVGFDGGDIDDVLLAATANDCDEFVNVKAISYDVESTNGDEILLKPDSVSGGASVSGVAPTSPAPTPASPPTSTSTTVTANAGPDRTINAGNSIRIGGSDSITNPSGPTTYSWASAGGSNGSLSSSTISRPTFNSRNISAGTTVTVSWRKTVTNNGVSDSDTVTITLSGPRQSGNGNGNRGGRTSGSGSRVHNGDETPDDGSPHEGGENGNSPGEGESPAPGLPPPATKAGLIEPQGFPLQTGDRVTYAGTTRYVVFLRPFLSDIHQSHAIKLATSYNNAVAGISITPPKVGTQVTKTAEPRYSCSGVIDSSRTPRDNMSDILSSMGGKAVYTQGKWKVRAAVYNPPILEYDESDIISKVNLQTKHSLRERFNAVKGQYISPINLGVPGEYPQIKNAFYQTEDGGERVFGSLDLLFTSRPHTAQRLAKIKLEEHRQSIIFKSSFNLTALAVQPTDTIFLSIPRMGWDRKPFEIIEWEFVGNNDDKRIPVFTVDMTLKETASGIYDWNMGEETTTDLAPNTNLANPLSPVTGITVEFEVIIGEDGTAYTRMKICWDPHPSPAASSYSVEYRKTGDLTWTPGGSVNTPNTCIIVEPVEPGVAYEVRVRARNFTGLDSPYGYFTSSGVVGDRTPPGDPTSITLDPDPGGYFVMWENPPDLDLDVIEVWERKIP